MNIGNKKIEDDNKKMILVLAVTYMILVCLLCSILIDRIRNNGDMVNSDDTTQTKNEESISIPGFERLTFEANKTKQTVSINNPSQNDCLFIVSLYLEDGTMLWKSDFIRPGRKSKPITLETPLEEGIYNNAMLKFDCYTKDKRTTLSGAETKLTIRVR